ncbi:MAG: hypothetical protein IKP43_01315 [Bacteroidaceae bacterium]|nr:hypothetical protein [Bacteroidaceae bacterium]
MKKLIIICAAMLAVSCTMYGQDKEAEKAKKAALKEATKQMGDAETALNTANTVYQALKSDPSNADNLSKLSAAMMDAESLITTALKNETVAQDPNAWNIAGRIETIKMNRLLEQRQTTGEMDLNAFFENQFNIVNYFSKCDACEKMPDAKGNPRKVVFHDINQQLARGPRQNLLIAGSNLFDKNPDACIKYLNLYFDSFKDPFFASLDLEKTDTMKTDAYFILASAYMEKGDTVSAEPYLAQAIDSHNYGQNAIFMLMQAHKDNAAEKIKYMKMGYEKYPQQAAFYKNLYQEYMNEKKFDDARAVLDQVIETNNDVDEKAWASYYKAATFYNEEKNQEAFDAFVKAGELKEDYVEAFEGAGNCAWKIAMANDKNKAVAKEWYDKAIKYYEKVREMAPDNPDKWGYFLYAIYNNSGNAAKANEFKKYSK